MSYFTAVIVHADIELIQLKKYCEIQNIDILVNTQNFSLEYKGNVYNCEEFLEKNNKNDDRIVLPMLRPSNVGHFLCFFHGFCYSQIVQDTVLMLLSEP